MNVFFGGGAPLPFLKALRCCGGAALLLRKEWRAAGARISLVVRRRCCPSSALELKKRRAANACEAGPRRLAMSPHLWMGGPHVFFMGDVAGGSAIVPRREGGPAHTQSFVSEPKDCGLGSIGAFFFFFWGSALPLFSFGDGGGPLPFVRPCGVAAVLPSFCGRSGVLPKSA